MLDFNFPDNAVCAVFAIAYQRNADVGGVSPDIVSGVHPEHGDGVFEINARYFGEFSEFETGRTKSFLQPCEHSACQEHDG